MPSRLNASTALLFVILAAALLGRCATGVERVRAQPDARLSGDEVVYLLLGDRLWHEGRYTTQGVERFLPLQRTIVPGYLHADVFKHPPVYPALVGASRRLSGGTLQAAYYPNLVLAVLSITVTYVLCRQLQVSTGFSLVGAALVAVSPVHWIAASRIWLDLSLATFVSLALVLQLRPDATRRWSLVALAWCAAVLTKAVAAVPWFAATLVVVIVDRDVRRSRRFWLAQAAVVASLVGWFVVLTANESASILASRMSRIDDARTLVRILPLFGAAALVSLPLLWFWRPASVNSAPSPAAIVVIATAALAIVALVGGLGRALLAQPWTGWDRNPLVESGRAFYFVYPALFDPIIVLGVCALVLVPHRRGALVLRAAWVALIVFLTAWGNYQTRYSLPLLQLEIAFASLVACAAWRDPRSTLVIRTLVAAWIVASITRSVWVLTQLRSNDFFYF